MKFSFSVLFLLALPLIVTAQVGLFVAPGVMNYGGDLQSASYTFSQSNICIGLGINYRINKFSINGSVMTGSVEANDKYTATSRRNLNFKSKLTEVSITLQYDFIDITGDKKITPYLLTGVGITRFNPYTYDVAGNKFYLQPLGTEGQGLALYPSRTIYNLSEFCVPIGAGVKYKLNDRLTAAIEYTTRFLNTDYLDDVSKTYPNQQALLDARGITAVQLSFRTPEVEPTAVYPEGKQRGNPKKNDNFYTTVFKLSYTFPPSQKKTGRTRSGNIRCPRKVSQAIP